MAPGARRRGRSCAARALGGMCSCGWPWAVVTCKFLIVSWGGFSRMGVLVCGDWRELIGAVWRVAGLGSCLGCSARQRRVLDRLPKASSRGCSDLGAALGLVWGLLR